MKTLKLISLLALLLLTSCYATRITSELYNLSSQNQELFKVLDFAIDENSLISYFPQQQTIVEQNEKETGKVTQIQMNTASINYEVNDMKNLIEKFMTPSDFSQSDLKMGKISFRLAFIDFHQSYFLPIFSSMTLGVFNLLGLPAGNHSCQLELEASVFDRADKKTAVYTGYGSDRYLTGLYYHNESERRASYIRSVKQALHQIDTGISAQRQDILRRLKK